MNAVKRYIVNSNVIEQKPGYNNYCKIVLPEEYNASMRFFARNDEELERKIRDWVKERDEFLHATLIMKKVDSALKILEEQRDHIEGGEE